MNQRPDQKIGAFLYTILYIVRGAHPVQVNTKGKMSSIFGENYDLKS